MRLPDPDPYSSRGNPWARAALRVLGWDIDIPHMPPRGVIVVYPHTSNWDFVIGILVVFALGWPVRWLGKHTLFRGLKGRLMRRWGGIPVNREEPEGLIDQVTETFRRHSTVHIAITPEGTRRYVPYWKSGFLRIASAARVPLVLAFIDYATRTVGVVESFVPGEDAAVDMDRIRGAYAGKQGRRPEHAGDIRLRN